MPDELTLQTQYRLVEALAKAERAARLRLENLHEIVFETDTTGRLTFVNQAWQRVLGSPPQTALGRPFGEFIVNEDRVAWAKLAESAAPETTLSDAITLRLPRAGLIESSRRCRYWRYNVLRLGPRFAKHELTFGCYGAG